MQPNSADGHPTIARLFAKVMTYLQNSVVELKLSMHSNLGLFTLQVSDLSLLLPIDQMP